MGLMRVLDLFSGIGGFSLGLERAGMQTVAFCEIEPYTRAVLRKHWPHVPCYDDIRTLTAERLRADGIVPDVICGGFPCQDISTAGNGVGIEGPRSGLWSEYARLIGELRPIYVIVENVAALLGRGLDRVLGDLATLGYDAEWHCIPASAVGAPHRRDRIWIVAYTDESRAMGFGRNGNCQNKEWDCAPQIQERENVQPWTDTTSENDVANAERGRLQSGDEQCAWSGAIIPPALGRHCGGCEFGEAWRTEPDVGRVAYGVPDQVDRLSALGNAVVPQIPEIIGRAIMSVHNQGEHI